MQNLYGILGVARNASNKEINAALRQLVRRYNEETANGTLDSADALRFVNHARLTFSNAERRARYDAELANFEIERAKAEQQATAPTAEVPESAPDDITRFDNEPAVSATTPVVNEAPPISQPIPEPTPPPSPVSQSQPLQPIESSDSSFDSVLVPIPLDQNTGRMTFLGTAKAIPGMGKELGSLLAAHGKKRQRSTAPEPGLRLAARLVDYGLWGIILAVALTYLSSAEIFSYQTVQILANPFVAPFIVTTSWIPIEALLLIFLPVTPGKFLLNIRVAANVSNPYAYNDPGALVSASFLRAFFVWWRGMAAGIFPFYLFTLVHGRKKLIDFKETTWDFDSDCLVTHGHVQLPKAALAALLVGGMVWIYAAYWVVPFWKTLSTGWQMAASGASTAKETWKILHGDMPTYGKEIPPAPAKENSTVALEKTAQELTDKRDWSNLSAHCEAWTKEEARNASAWFCYGRARKELGDHAGAIAALKRAALLDPKNDDIRRLLKDSSQIEMQKKLLRNRQSGEEPKSSPAQDTAEQPETNSGK